MYPRAASISPLARFSHDFPLRAPWRVFEERTARACARLERATRRCSSSGVLRGEALPRPRDERKRQRTRVVGHVRITCRRFQEHVGCHASRRSIAPPHVWQHGAPSPLDSSGIRDHRPPGCAATERRRRVARGQHARRGARLAGGRGSRSRRACTLAAPPLIGAAARAALASRVCPPGALSRGLNGALSLPGPSTHGSLDRAFAPRPFSRCSVLCVDGARWLTPARARAWRCTRGIAPKWASTRCRASATRLPRACGLGFHQPLRDLLTVEAGDDTVEQTRANADEGMALANAYVGRVILADARRGQRLV